MRRNLHYYVYPKKGEQWAWNLSKLRPYLGAFNGRLIVAVSQDDGTEPLSTVRKEFGDKRACFIESRNDPSQGETSSFLDVMRMLRSEDPEELTFYAHAKGSRHEGDRSVLPRVRAWIDCMLLSNLGSVEVVEGLMRTRAAVGCIRKVMDHQGSSWHYSGTFFWYKHSSVFSRDWMTMTPGIYGVESYLGRRLHVSESYDLTRGRDFGDLYKTMIPVDEVRRMHQEMVSSALVGALG